MYEDLGHVYAKYFDVPYEVSELETVPEADEKSWTTEGEASVLELEQSATERDVAHIVEGHEDLLAMRDQMFIDDANTPCLVGYETIHFDSGANCVLLKTDAMIAASKPLDSSKGALGTASQSGKLTHEGTANVTMYVKGGANEHSPVELEGYRAPKAKRNVVPPQALEAIGATIGLHRTKYDDATWDITFPNGHSWLALKYNGLHFGFVKLDAQENAEASATEAEELEATMKRGDVPAHVWAARLVTGVDGLQATQKAVLNMKMSSLTPRAMRAIEMDQHRRGSVAKRVPTNAKRDATTRTNADIETSAGDAHVANP
jgi:hypothetical protein